MYSLLQYQKDFFTCIQQYLCKRKESQKGLIIYEMDPQKRLSVTFMNSFKASNKQQLVVEKVMLLKNEGNKLRCKYFLPFYVSIWNQTIFWHSWKGFTLKSNFDINKHLEVPYCLRLCIEHAHGIDKKPELGLLNSL